MAILGEPVLLSDIVDPFGPKGDAVVSEAIVPMWRQRLRIFMHNKLAIASVAYLVLVLLFCYAGPLFYHTNQTNQASHQSDQSGDRPQRGMERPSFRTALAGYRQLWF